MKKLFISALLVAMIILSGCSRVDKLAQYTVNAVVTRVDAENKTICVTDPGEENVFGEECILDCSEIDKVIYCDYSDGSLEFIDISDLAPGDNIIVDADERELGCAGNGEARISRIQLSTQRY